MGPRGRWGLQVPTHISSAMTRSVQGQEGDPVLGGSSPSPPSLLFTPLMGKLPATACSVGLKLRPRLKGSFCLNS